MGMLSLLMCLSVITVTGLKADTGCINMEFLKAREGFKVSGYVPTKNGKVLGNSGVTIGSGVDLGSKNRKYFKNLGVPKSVIDKLVPYFGLKKEAAVEALNKRPLTLTEDEAEDLSERVMTANLGSVKRRYNKEIGPGKLTWDQLTIAQRTVIASVMYQYGRPCKTPKFWKYCKNQNWKKVEHELRNFRDDYSSRRELEADLLKNDDGSNCGVSSG